MFRKLSIILVICMVLMPMAVNAESLAAETQTVSSDVKIDSVSELKSAIDAAYDKDGKMTEAEAESIIADASLEVVIAFIDEKIADMNTAIENADIDIDKVINNGSDGYGKVKLDIGDHTEVILEFEDKEDLSVVDSIKDAIAPASYAATNGETMWKAYGNRYFTAKANVLSGIGGAVLKLENHYKVSANGLDERFGDAYVSFHFSVGITGNISANTPIITDSSARTPGASDINMYARYPYHFDGQGIAASGGTYKISTTVGYVQKDATNKRIKVKHSWKTTNS